MVLSAQARAFEKSDMIRLAFDNVFKFTFVLLMRAKFGLNSRIKFIYACACIWISVVDLEMHF